MEGKGWFVIYGALAILTVYLFIAQQSQAGQVKQLQADLDQIKTQLERPADEQTTDEESASPEAGSTPDLSTASARDIQRKKDLLAISAALDQFQGQKRSYPTTLSELVPNQLRALPKDPLAPKYSFRYQKTASGFRLTAYLESTTDPDDQKSDGKKDHIFTLTEKSQ